MLGLSRSKNIIAGMVGNVLEHYDRALFGFIAPLIAPLFFASSDSVTALILTYMMLALGTLARPLGALLFGYLGDRIGRKPVLLISITGMAITTVAVGCTPTYAYIGGLAAFLLGIARALQHFFASGESTSAAVFVLEHAPAEQRPLVSGIFASSSILGTLIASGQAAIFSYWGILDTHWRYCLWFGGVIGLIAFAWRSKLTESKEFENAPKSSFVPLSVLRQHKRALIAITLAAGFSCSTYVMAITFMNGFLLIVSPMSHTQLMGVCTGLLVMDGLLLPVFGYLSKKFTVEVVMFWAAAIASVVALPLFYSLSSASLAGVIFVQVVIIVLGVAFAAPFRLWAQQLLPTTHRCTIIGLGCALGHMLIEAPAAVVSLWLYQQTGWTAAPGIYLAVTSLMAAGAVYFCSTASNEEPSVAIRFNES